MRVGRPFVDLPEGLISFHRSIVQLNDEFNSSLIFIGVILTQLGIPGVHSCVYCCT